MDALFTTPRLAVRPFQPLDAAALHRICGDPATMARVGDGSTLSLDRCAEWIASSRRDYARRGYGAWALFVRDEPALAGYCGIVPAPRRADPELIYALRPEWWGQGLASELVPALVDFGFRTLNLGRLVATVVPGNGASQRVLEKSGLHFTGEETDRHGRMLRVFVIEGGGLP